MPFDGYPTRPSSIERPYGWVIVLVATVCLTLGFGANVTVSVLIEPLEREFGWPRADISMAYTMVTIGAAGGGLFWGTLSDRVGAIRIAFTGAAVLAGSLMAISFQSDLAGLYAFYLTVGGFGFACLFTPPLALVSLWFDRRRGLALGIVTAGGALGQGLVPFVLRTLMESMDWRQAIFALGAGYFAILVPLLFLLRPAPRLFGGTGPVGHTSAWGVPPRITLPWLGIAGVFCCMCMAVPIVHLVPLGNAVCLTPGTGTDLLMTAMLCGVAGRVFFGSLADRIGGLIAYGAASFAQSAVVHWFTQTDALPALFVLAALFGFGFSGVMTCLIVCAREAAPARIAGFAVASVTAAAWLGMGLGAYMGGYLYDLSGAYVLSYGMAALAGIANLCVVAALMLYLRRVRRTPACA